MATPVLLHGFSTSSASWGPEIVDGLSARVGPPALVDAPGHGRHASRRDSEAYALASVHDDLDAALAHGPAPLVGYSMGGRLALSYAVARPERVSRLVLESASPGLADEGARRARRAADDALADEIEARGMAWFVDHWDALPIFATRAGLPVHVRGRQRAVRLANESGGLALALRHLGTGVLPSYWEAIRTMDVPTLLVVGELDEKFVGVARAMADRMPRARVAVVPDAGHTVHLERPDAWLDAVSEFLAG